MGSEHFVKQLSVNTVHLHMKLNDCILFLFTFHTAAQLFWDRVVVLFIFTPGGSIDISNAGTEGKSKGLISQYDDVPCEVK